MPIVTNITGAAWPTSGSATPGTTGFDKMTTGATHVGSTDVPPGSSATGYIEFPSFTSIGMMFQPTTEGYQSGEEWHWVRFWIYFNRTSTMTDNQQVSWLDTVSSGTKLRIQLISNVADPDGFLLSSTSFIGGTSTSIGNKGYSVMPVNKWTEITIGRRYHATQGQQIVIVNGVKVTESYGMDTTTIGLSAMRSQWSFGGLSAGFSGGKIRVSGPCETWSGTDISIRPRYDLSPSASYMKQYMIIHRNDTQTNKGRFWDYSGTGTLTKTHYATGGVNPSAGRMVVSGSTGVTFGMYSVDDIGTLSFNSEGYFSFVLTQFYLPGGSTIDFAIRNTADNADIIKLSVDASLNLKQGATTLTSGLSASVRYALGITLKNTGEAYWFLVDLTNQFTTQTLKSGQLTNWTNQSIGKIKIDMVRGTSSCDVGGVMLTQYVETVMTDSLVSASANGLSPAMASNDNHTGTVLPSLSEEHAVPNCAARQTSWESLGLGWRAFNFDMGRSGDSLTNFYTYTYLNGGLDNIHGWIIWFMDGFGSINDIANPVSDSTTRDTVVNNLNTYMGNIMDKLIAGNNKMFVTTMIDRTLKTGLVTLTDPDLQAIHLHNNYIREYVKSHQNDLQYIKFSDAAAYIGYHNDLFTSGDNIHFNSAGDSTYISAVISNRTTPDYTAQLGQVNSLAAIAGNEKIDLTWTAPSAGGPTLTDYVVEYKLSSSSTWIVFSDGVSTTPGASITGLTNGLFYDVRVAAKNTAGTGSYDTIRDVLPFNAIAPGVSVGSFKSSAVDIHI